MLFPLGPYHPALPEPLALRLALRGETVTGVELQLGYLHRGVEELAPGRDLKGVLDLVERTCGTCGHSHRLAVCLALESAAGVKVPQRASVLRTVFAEVERLQARLWFLQQVGRVGEFGNLMNAAIEAREIVFEACLAATETRLFWGVPMPGGINTIPDPMALVGAMEDSEASIVRIERLLAERGSLTRRTMGLGKLSSTTVTELGATGLLERAAGRDTDVRLAMPYDAYQGMDGDGLQSGDLRQYLVGDVASRLRLAINEVRQSMQLITTLLEALPDGQERAPFPATLNPQTATATVEGPHGRETVKLQIGATGDRAVDTQQAGWLTRLTLQTPSATNIGLLPIALDRQKLADVPLILASLDLCIACVDR
jgi:Ni,Fe-hydrogenase III large subunit